MSYRQVTMYFEQWTPKSFQQNLPSQHYIDRILGMSGGGHLAHRQAKYKSSSINQCNWRNIILIIYMMIISCNQLNGPVCLSTWPSFCPSHYFTMFLWLYHHELSGVITIDKSYFHANGWVQMSMAKVREVKQVLPKYGHFKTVNPAWIHGWPQNDVQSLHWYMRGALLFSRSSNKF